MPVWLPPSVKHVPRLVLISWTLIETELGEVHAVGYDVDAAEGRVSSPLHRFDTASRVGATRSGRVYELRGSSGTHGDAQYVLSHWLALNRVASWTDVTDQVLARGLPTTASDRS